MKIVDSPEPRISPASVLRGRAIRGLLILAPALFLAGLLAAVVGGQEPAKEAAPRPTISQPERIVQEQLEAYNRHDIESFLKTYSPEIKLYEFPDKELSSGLDAMRKTYGKVFKDEPDRKARIAKRIVQGDYVIDHEQVSGGGRKFAAVAVYRVQEGKIIAVWFLK